MSRPARVSSDSTTASASVNSSRKTISFMQVDSGRPAMRAVYQRGRGHEPVTVVGRTRSRVAVNMESTGPAGPQRITPWQFQQADGVQDWRVLGEGAVA